MVVVRDYRDLSKCACSLRPPGFLIYWSIQSRVWRGTLKLNEIGRFHTKTTNRDKHFPIPWTSPGDKSTSRYSNFPSFYVMFFFRRKCQFYYLFCWHRSVLGWYGKRNLFSLIWTVFDMFFLRDLSSIKTILIYNQVSIKLVFISEASFKTRNFG